MTHAVLPQSPAQWFHHLFSARSAREGGIVRRKTRDMERMVGRALFEREIKRRGFSVVENAGQIVVFCNAEPVMLRIGRGKSS